MKNKNFQPFEKKSHNQKIRDAYLQRTEEKQAAKQVMLVQENSSIACFFVL